MNTLFGVPVDILMWVFIFLTAVIIAGAIISAIRQPVLLRLSIRNIPRRLGRSVLIVTGLMLATTIISAAFTTGDTINSTIRTEVITGLGNIDEVISAQEESDIEVTGESLQTTYFDESYFLTVRDALADDPNVDGVMPVIWEGTGIQNLVAGRTEPRVTVFAVDPAYMSGFGTISNVSGGTVSMSDLAPNEVYLNPEASDDLAAVAGDEVVVYGPAGQQNVIVKAVVRYDGAGTISTEPGIMALLSSAQALFQKESLIGHIAISNRGGAETGADLTDDVIDAVQHTLTELGLSIEPTKQEDLAEADEAGDAFSTFFITFGSFSIAAGIMLIFLIFVMLAAERKPEMGISRAIGTERRHLIEMFSFEGLTYDIFAAAIGALLGIAVAWVMVEMVARVISEFGVEMRRTFSTQSLVTAYTMGVVLTFIVVSVSAWRVSLLNIVTAIRDLPDPQKKTGRASLIWGAVFLGLGSLLSYLGVVAEDATLFYLGISLLILSTIPVLRWFGISDRIAFSIPGVALVIFWILPLDTLDPVLPDMSAGFNWFISGGLIVVMGSTWVVMYNSDRLLGLAMNTLGKIRGLAPILKTAISYPLTSRFRTGMTLAMFTLVVFTLVIGAVTTTAFTNAYDDISVYGGGFEIRAETVRSNPIDDLDAAVQSSETLDPASFEAIAGQSLVATEARQVDTASDFESYPLRGFDDEFFDTTTYKMAAFGEGYDTPEAVWQAVKDSPGFAVLDGLPVPRRDNFDFGGQPTDFTVTGFYVEDGTFAPFDVEVRDPITGSQTTVTVIGILQDVAPAFMIGLLTSQQVVDDYFPAQAAPVAHLIKLAPGTNAEDTADALEAEFLPNGMEAVVLSDELSDLLALNRTFNYIVQGFLGLGLVVGVAALGVISARAVVERRHEIGVMRAIGFERGRVQLSFLIEACMTAIAGIVIGTTLGIIISFNIIRDTKTQPSWENLDYTVPWINLAIIFAIVLAAALITAYLPARQASRVYPAEALRYQ